MARLLVVVVLLLVATVALCEMLPYVNDAEEVLMDSQDDAAAKPAGTGKTDKLSPEEKAFIRTITANRAFLPGYGGFGGYGGLGYGGYGGYGLGYGGLGFFDEDGDAQSDPEEIFANDFEEAIEGQSNEEDSMMEGGHHGKSSRKVLQLPKRLVKALIEQFGTQTKGVEHSMARTTSETRRGWLARIRSYMRRHGYGQKRRNTKILYVVPASKTEEI